MAVVQLSIISAVSVSQHAPPREFVFTASQSKPLDFYGSMQHCVDFGGFLEGIKRTPFAFQKTFWCNCMASTC